MLNRNDESKISSAVQPVGGWSSMMGTKLLENWKLNGRRLKGIIFHVYKDSVLWRQGEITDSHV